MAKRTKKHSVTAGPIYQDLLVSKFINYLMKDGKKTVAQNIFYHALTILRQRFEMAQANKAFAHLGWEV